MDRFREFANQPCLAGYLGDACALPFHDQSLNHVASSHLLEHTASPVAALMEWYRVVRPGGIIYCVVSDKRYTWDRWRATTAIFAPPAAAEYFPRTLAPPPGPGKIRA